VSPILGIYASSISPSLNASSYASIATVTVGAGGASSIDFTGIPSTYKHLQVRGIHRITNASFYTGDCFMRVGNGSIDSGSNYANHQLYGDGTSASTAGASSRTSVLGYGAYNSVGSLGYANTFAATIVDVLDYQNSNKYKTMRFLAGREMNSNNTDGRMFLESGLWMNTAAITNLSFYALDGAGSASTFAQYSSFALYGIKA
jgi:hypothetical protein